jgi:hypothetical protein
METSDLPTVVVVLGVLALLRVALIGFRAIGKLDTSTDRENDRTSTQASEETQVKRLLVVALAAVPLIAVATPAAAAPAPSCIPGRSL